MIDILAAKSDVMKIVLAYTGCPCSLWPFRFGTYQEISVLSLVSGL